MSATADARLRDLLNGFQASEALHAAVVVGVPDALTNGACTLHTLARATRTQPDALSRLLRVLADLDVVAHDAEGRYRLTAIGQRLRPDVDGNWHAWARMIGTSAIRMSWGHLAEAVRAGITGFELAHGSDIWAYRSSHPDEGELFDSAMRSGTQRLANPIARCLGDLAGQHVVDVGGGDGTLLSHLLLQHPCASGTLVERGRAARRARALLAQHGLLDRARVVEGDFFRAVPPQGHLYLLKFVLHDWGDDQAVRLLQTCWTAVSTTGHEASLVLIERLLDAPPGGLEASLADLNMLVNTGGRERTRHEYEKLLERAGFEMSSCQAVAGTLTVMRAKARKSREC